MKTKFTTSLIRGFSLVELLTVVAIIGVIAAITIPHVNTASSAETARDRRHAQELSSFSVAAQAAGLDLVIPGNLNATLQKILEGGVPTTGSFKGHAFIAPKMKIEDAKAASRFLRLEADALLYRYEG